MLVGEILVPVRGLLGWNATDHRREEMGFSAADAGRRPRKENRVDSASRKAHLHPSSSSSSSSSSSQSKYSAIGFDPYPYSFIIFLHIYIYIYGYVCVGVCCIYE